MTIVARHGEKVNRLSENQAQIVAGDGSLGIHTKLASAREENTVSETATARRLRLQAAAGDLLPDDRIAQCMKFTAPVDPQQPGNGVYQHVDIKRNVETGRCTAHNLILCHRGWMCSVCSARISEERRKELEVVYYYSGKWFLLATFTLRHKRPDSLENVLDGLTAALRGMKSGRGWQDLKREFDWLGDIKALEITHGENGWHPHAHVLMVFDRQLTPHLVSVLEAQLKAKWRDVLRRSGMEATYEHGCQVTGANSEIVNYITKYGHLPKDESDAWRGPEELTKAQQKMGRAGGRTIWEILDEYDRTGDAEAARLFREYAAATRGRSQLHWSRGLKELLDLEALLVEYGEPEPETEFVIGVDRQEWLALYWCRRRAAFLDLCEQGELSESVRLLSMCLERYHHAKGRASPWSWPAN